MKKKLLSLVVTGLLFWFTGNAYALDFTFYEVTNNSSINVASQLKLEVTDDGSQTTFEFKNTGPIVSSATDIYINWGTNSALSFDSFDTSGVVAFSTPATPAELPGGTFTASFSADSDAPVAANGINNFDGSGTQDILEIIFNGTLADISAIQAGIHVQALSDGQSEGYETNNGGGNPVPEPATMLLFGSGLVGLAGISRSRKKKAIK